MNRDDQHDFLRSLRPIMPWAIAGNMAMVGMLLSVNSALQGSALGWGATVVCLLVLAAVAGRLAWWMINLAKRKLRWWKEFQESGKANISLRESLAGRIATDGRAATAATFAWCCLKSALKWCLVSVALLALGSYSNSEFERFHQYVVIYAVVGAALGLLIGALFQLLGRRLRIVEGSHVAMKVPGGSAKTWKLSQLASSEISDGPAGYSSIKLRFNDKPERGTELRLIARVRAEIADDLRRLLGRKQLPA